MVLYCEQYASTFLLQLVLQLMQVHEQSNARDAANNVTTKPGKGDLHGGTHVHSTTEVVILSDDEEYHEFDIEVPLIVNTPGSFFVISAVQFFVGNASEFYLPGASITRYDIGNSAAQRVVVFEEPAEVNDIQQGVAIGLYIITALSCFVILFLLEEAIRHRKNQIMKLSQGAFLIVLLLAALLATACVPISNPTISDLMCQLSPPLIAIPLQLIYAIIIGRVWRTQQVLSPLLSEFYETPISSVFGKVIRFLACAGKRTNSLKATVTNRQLATAVFVLTLPQVFIHTFALIFQPRRIEIMYTDDASVGRQQCGSDGRDWLTLVDFGYYTIFLMNIVLLVVAQGSKRLPSLFNEMQMIVGMSWTNFIVLLIGITILVVTNTPSTPPDVSYIIWAMVILSITLNSSIRLMYPKLRMIWNGETVLVSKLVTDHKKTVAAKRKNDSNFKSIRSKLMKGVTGFSMRASYNSPARDERTPKETVNSGFSSDFPSGNENSEAEKDVEGAFNDDSNTPIQLNGNLGPSGHDSNGSILEDTLAVIAFEEGEPFARRPGQADDGISPMEAIKEDIEISTKQPRRDAETTRKPSPETSSEYASAQPPKKRMPSKRSKSHRVLVGDQHTPSRTLVVPMVKLQEKLIAINTRVTTGLSVSHKEWEELRSMTAKLGEKFSDEVTFEWEQTMPQPSIS
jgi:hypothetical protein